METSNTSSSSSTVSRGREQELEKALREQQGTLAHSQVVELLQLKYERVKEKLVLSSDESVRGRALELKDLLKALSDV